MEVCPYCMQQVQVRKNASTGAQVGKCPVHGDIPAHLLLKVPR